MAEPGGERWRRIEEIMEVALALLPSSRATYLAMATNGDDGLRREVESLIAAHERAGPVDRLAADLAPLAARVRDASTLGSSPQGRRVGPYDVMERVGGGGMGIVHKALDQRLGRTIALKFLQPALSEDTAAAERFRLEARAIAALEHPNICTIHEIGETDDGQLYLAMPLYEGETVQRRIQASALPMDDALSIAIQVARALAKAHARGIIHRDIKPSNILVTADGVVKLLDFGIAKLVGVKLTGTGATLGTLDYMSPEQALGYAVDHRTDLWSLGVVLYEMLAGQRPFDGGAGAALNGILNVEPRPVSELRAGIPAELDHLVSRALAKKPDERYQTAQELEEDLSAIARLVSAPGGATTSAALRRSPLRRRALFRGAIGVGVAMALGVATWFALTQSRPSTVAPVTTPAIAVLPFVDQSPSGDHGYFSDGITEELISTLGRAGGLRVASRTSAFSFKGRDVDIPTVGSTLGVSTVLEGSVRRSGDRLRINVRLLNAADGFPLWSETYDRNTGEAFAIQEDIARSIAQMLRVRLVTAGTSAATGDRPDAEAYELYLKGLHALYLRTRYAFSRKHQETLQEAVNYFRQAIARAPNYARAHAFLATTYSTIGFFDYLPANAAFPAAESSATRAIALDSGLAVAHNVLAYAQLYHRWDFANAEASFRRAIAIDPHYPTSHQWYGNLLTVLGRSNEADAVMNRAMELDPLALTPKAARGWAHYFAGDYTAALSQLGETLALNPDYGYALLWRGWALQEVDSLREAVELHRRAVAVSDSGAIWVTSLARSLALAGERREAESLLRRLEAKRDSGRYVPSYELAKVHLALGRDEEALDHLERALALRSHSMVFLRVDPQLGRLRSNPRFTRLVEQVFPRDR